MAGTTTQVTELYVATFMRAPDAPGIEYWVASSLSIEEIAQSFFDQPETQALYGDTITDYTAFVNAIYNNMFNHGPDEVGLAYWVAELESGNITPGNMILAIANGALGTDDQILTNKTLVGLDFADSGLSDYDQSVEIMVGITVDPATVVAAAAQIAIWESELGSQFFTIKRDTLIDKYGDDTFFGLVTGDAATTTYQDNDSADGGDGNDRLEITSTAVGEVTTGDTEISNIETLHLINHGGEKMTVDTTRFDDKIGTIIAEGSQAITIGGVGGDGLNAVANIELSMNAAGKEVTLHYDDAALTKADAMAAAGTTMSVTLTNSTQQQLSANGIENYAVHTGSGVQ
ncbi:MAG: DUF4214 domain-containing protein, partial [Campylobacterota bacterium]|nr:DUF4214 domain-containing protein [Campylobacterota bacterium]